MKRDKEAEQKVIDKAGVALSEPVVEAVAPTPEPTPVQQILASQEIHKVQDIPAQYGQTHRFNCLHKLQPNEPFFVLRAQDLLAPHLVEQWAMNAEKQGCDPAKVQEARRCALHMMAWKGRKYPD